MITDRPEVKVNYILDAQKNRKCNLDTIVHISFEIITKKAIDLENNVKKSSPTAMDSL